MEMKNGNLKVELEQFLECEKEEELFTGYPLTVSVTLQVLAELDFQWKIGFNKGLIFATNFEAQIFEMSLAVSFHQKLILN